MRRHTYNNLGKYSMASAVTAIASVALAILTRLNPIFLLLAGAAYLVHYQANKHINASPVIRDQTTLPANYFDANNPLRTQHLREFMGLAQPVVAQSSSAQSASAQQKPWEPEFWGFKNYLSFKRQIPTDLATIDHASPELLSVRETEARRPNNGTVHA